MRVDDDVDVGLALTLGLGLGFRTSHRIQQATTGLSNTATGRASAASVVASVAATLVAFAAVFRWLFCFIRLALPIFPFVHICDGLWHHSGGI